MAHEDVLTLQEVADELDVHYQTVYRWVRSGVLEASKIAGQYAVSMSSLDSYRQSRRAATPPPAPSPQRLDRQSTAMTEALLKGDETAASRIARQLVSNGASITALIESVLVPPLIEIGQRWHDGELSIYVEHRASAIVGRLLGELSPNPPGRRRGTAVVAALSGDRHMLPTAMATAALREDGWRVEHLGADIPAEQIAQFIGGHPVDLVVLSATGRGAAKRANRAKLEIEDEHSVPVLVGGAGATLSDLKVEARRTRERS